MKENNRNNKNNKTYSPAAYKAASVGAFVWGIMVSLLGLVLLFIVPLLGIIVTILGWSCFFISNNFRKQAKEAKEKEKQAEELKQHFE